MLGPVLTVVVGIGTSSGVTPAEVAALVDEALAAAGLARSAVVAVATIATKADEPVLREHDVALAGKVAHLVEHVDPAASGVIGERTELG